jgi:hypothetical protein
LNGVNVTDPTALGASATYYAYDAFEEVQVSTAGHDAEIQPPGVILNIVLKGGGNQLEGGASFYVENDTLQSDNLDDRLRAQGVPSSGRLDSYYDLSAELGGPIVRDRAFFYASYARQRIAPFVIGFFLPGGEPESTAPIFRPWWRARRLARIPREPGVSLLPEPELRPYRDASRFRRLRQRRSTRLHHRRFQGLYSRLLGDKALLDARFSLVDLDFPSAKIPSYQTTPTLGSSSRAGSGAEVPAPTSSSRGIAGRQTPLSSSSPTNGCRAPTTSSSGGKARGIGRAPAMTSRGRSSTGIFSRRRFRSRSIASR